jgi:hypothetical protein
MHVISNKVERPQVEFTFINRQMVILLKKNGVDEINFTNSYDTQLTILSNE